jgi:Flp pilus assembly protein TadG
MYRLFATIGRDEAGTTTIEFTIVALLFLMLTFGLVEFGYMLFQYNSATKALQFGARMAAVSDPVWSALTGLQSNGTAGGSWDWPYDVTCTGTNASGTSVSCSGTSNSTSVNANYTGVTTLQRLVFGRGDTTCGTIGTDGDPGMCDIFDRITPRNVNVEYSSTGLGFAGRPGGPVPTITVTLTGLTFQFFALGALMGFQDVTMPDFKLTMTGEDLSAAAVP